MVGSWAFFGEKLKSIIEPGKIKIVAVDALPVQLEYIEKNYVQVLLGQPTFTWGEVTVQAVIDKIYLKKKVEEIIRLNTIPVSIKNLGGWSRQLRAWGYTEIPEKYLIM
jgi:ABC-type sugar transport system substrate-binding protein